MVLILANTMFGFPSHMHSSGVHHLLSLEMLKKHFCLEANITNTNNVLDQPEKPASGRGIIMKDGGRGEGKRVSFTHRRMAMGHLSWL